MSYEVKDKNNIPKYIDMLEELTSTVIEVGIFGKDGERYEDGTPILLIANVNEFGLNISVTPEMRAYLHGQGLHLRNSTREIRIPERSYIRSGFDDREKKFRKTANKLLEQVLMQEIRLDTFFKTLGEYIVGELQDYMTDIRTPPNHPFTIAQKGSSNPLIDTGRLRQAITFRVVKR